MLAAKHDAMRRALALVASSVLLFTLLAAFAHTAAAARAEIAFVETQQEAAQQQRDTHLDQQQPPASSSPSTTNTNPSDKSSRVIECDLTVDSGLCLFGGEKVIVPDAVPKGLVGHWTFDDGQLLDSSRRRNHGTSVIPAAPGRGGLGASAMFNGNDWAEIPHSPSLLLSDSGANGFSISLWIFVPVHASKGVSWCPVVVKGQSDNENGPGLYYDHVNRHLMGVTSQGDLKTADFVFSFARVHPGRWTHVALVRSDKQLDLYVNGIPDATNETVTSLSSLEANHAPFYLGNTPWHNRDCAVSFLIDDLRVWNRKLELMEIEAESFPSLGVVEPAFVRVGCKDCSLEQTVQSCSRGYHVCSLRDLNFGAYQVARTMGWIDWTSHVWAAEGNFDTVHDPKNINRTGLGLCCRDP